MDMAGFFLLSQVICLGLEIYQSKSIVEQPFISCDMYIMKKARFPKKKLIYALGIIVMLAIAY